MGRLFSDTPESQCGKHSRFGDLCRLRNRTRGIAQSGRLLLQGLRTAIWLRVFVEQQDGDSRRCRRFYMAIQTVTGSTHNMGFTLTETFPDGSNGIQPSFLLSQGLPPWTAPPFVDPSVSNGAGVSWWQGREATRPPASYNVNLSIQRQLSSSMVLETSYNAVIGAHLQDGVLNYNQVNPAYLAKDGAALLTPPTNASAAIPAPITAPFPGSQHRRSARATVAQA